MKKEFRILTLVFLVVFALCESCNQPRKENSLFALVDNTLLEGKLLITETPQLNPKHKKIFAKIESASNINNLQSE